MSLPADPTQQFRLDERTVIVTGASLGLGSRFARVVAGAGATVIAGARRRERLEALVDELRSEGADAVAVECDVTVDSDVERLIAVALPAIGHEDDPEAVRILERHPTLGPVWVGGRDRIDAEARRDRLHRLIVAEVEHE